MTASWPKRDHEPRTRRTSASNRAMSSWFRREMTVRKRKRSRRWLRERLLIIGRVPLTEQIVAEIDTRPGGRLVVGIVDDQAACPALPGDCPVLGPMSRLAEIIS